MTMTRVGVFSFVMLMLSCAALFVPGTAQGGETTVGVAVAHGEQSSQAYDVYAAYTFSPWLEGECALSPLVEAGLLIWERSGRTIWGGGGHVGLMLRFFENGTVRPFVSGTFGVVQISSDSFGYLDLGTHTQFRSRGSVGVDFGEGLRHTVKCSVTHYSNAGMSADNDGYNTVGLSYGLTF